MKGEIKMKILKVLVRIFLDQDKLNTTIAFYEELFCSKCKMRFQYPEVGLELAQIESVLLIAGTKNARQPFQKTQSTFLVDCLNDFRDKLISDNAIIIEQPKSVPTGKNMRVQHPDGTIIEYVEHSK